MADAPTVNELLYPTLEAFKALGGSATNKEHYDWISESGRYSEEQLSVLHVDDTRTRTRIDYNLAWARTRLKKLGALESKGGGLWLLTSFGATLTAKEIESLRKKYRKEESEKRKKKKNKEFTFVSDEENNNSEDTGHWKEELLDKIKNITAEQFELLSKRVLGRAGFSEVEVTQISNDKGIDGVGLLEVNLASFKIVFQCKRYKDSVGAPDLQKFRGAKEGKADRALFITTGTFTKEARKEATKDGAMLINLIDGEEFCELLKKYGLGVSVETVEEVTINHSFFDGIK